MMAYVPLRLGPATTNRLNYRHPPQMRLKAIICDQVSHWTNSGILDSKNS